MIFRFGPFELDDGSGDLLRDGRPVPMQPKPLALLRMLLIERDRIVPTDEIFAALWPDTRVTSSSLPRAASFVRRALGDGNKQGLIRSYPRRGYRFCGDVVVIDAAPSREAATAQAGASSRPVDGVIPFVGRDDALESLARAFGSAAQGMGGCALVSGRAGMGKSRLVEEFAQRAEQRGARCFRGCAHDREGAPALWVFEQVLRQLARDPELAADVEQFAARTHELRELLPELGATEPDPARTHQVEQGRFRFFDASTRLLIRCARRRPLVVVLEDLQWAGAAALHLLEHLAAELTQHPILLIGTVRDEARATTERLTRTLAHLRRHDRCVWVELRGLSRGEVAELLRRTTGAAVPGDLTSELYAQTEGVPLFLREAVRVFLRRQDVAQPERLLELGFALPEPARDLIGRALHDLSSAGRELVRAACVLGREFDLRTATSLAGLDPHVALECIDEATRAGVLEPIAGTGTRHRFAHALHRELAYGGLGSADRTRLHLHAAELLEQRHAAELDRVAAELAHHYLQGIAVADPTRAYRYAARAAERAAAVFAHEQAAQHYEQALSALEHFDPIDPSLRLETLLALGTAHRLAGDRGRRRAVLSEALELARALRRKLELARAAIELCDISEWSHEDPAARMALLEALELLGDACVLERARILTRLAYLAQRTRERAEPHARESVELAREAGDPHTRQDALYVLSYTIAGPDDMEERALIADEIVELAERGGAHTPCVITLIDAACDRIALGDGVGASRRREQAAKVAGARPTPVMVWHMQVYDTGFALLRGDLDQVEERIEGAFRVGQRIDHPFAAGCAVAHRVGLARERGEWPRAVELLERIRGADAPYVWVQSLLGRTRAAAGELEHARAIWATLSGVDAGPERRDFPDVARGIRWTDSMVELAHLCADLGVESRAEPLVRALEPYEHHHGVLPVPICYGGPVAHALARLYAMLGERDLAEQAFASALERSRALGARPTEARVLLDHARYLEPRSARRSAELRQQASALLAAIHASG